jgi:hypothetical protein
MHMKKRYASSNRWHQPDLNPGRQGVRQSALHCTTEAMAIYINKSSIKTIYMTLNYMCVFLLFPLCSFSRRPIINNSVTPYVFFHDDQWKTTLLPLMFFFMTTNKKQQCYPLCFFSWRPMKKEQCYPLCFFFMTTNKIRQCYPLCFFSWRPKKKNNVTPYVLFDKYRQCYPLCLFHDGR